KRSRKARPGRSSSARSRLPKRSSSYAPVPRAGLDGCRYAEHLTVRARTFLAIFGVLVALPMGSSAWAQDASSTPSPKELWNAYPLAPEDAAAAGTPAQA